MSSDAASVTGTATRARRFEESTASAREQPSRAVSRVAETETGAIAVKCGETRIESESQQTSQRRMVFEFSALW